MAALVNWELARLASGVPGISPPDVLTAFSAAVAVKLALLCGNDVSAVRTPPEIPDEVLDGMFDELVAEMEEAPYTDVLGGLFMSSGLAWSGAGQFFTPPSLARLSAALSALRGSDGVRRVCDPACGAGAMLLACAGDMAREGRSPAIWMWAEGQDISENAALMCYAQLSLSGLAGRVTCGDTLTGEARWSLLTPVAVLDSLWMTRRALWAV